MHNNTIDLNYEIESLLNKLILILTENHGEMSYKNLLKSIYNKYPNTKLYNILHRIINYKSKKLLHFLNICYMIYMKMNNIVKMNLLKILI